MSGKAFKRVGEKSTPESKEKVRQEILKIMNKTKEEIIESTYRNIPMESRAYHQKSILEIMEEYGSQCRKEGFEAFREKVEDIYIRDYSNTQTREDILETIKEIRQ
jgi:hypothetical protein